MNNLNNPISFTSRGPRGQLIQRKSRNYNQLKPVFETMRWKQYAVNGPRRNSIQNAQRLSVKNSVRNHNSPSYHQSQIYDRNVPSRLSQRQIREQNLRLSGSKYDPRQQQMNKIKQDAVRRVKMLQQKVLPLISNEQQKFRNQQQEYGLAWQLKIQQKLIKIQNSVQNIKNQMQIKFQKKLIQMQRIWQNRFNELLDLIQGNNYRNERQNQDQIQYMNDNINGHRIEMNQKEHQSNYNNSQRNTNSGNYKYYRSGFNDGQNQEY